MSTISGFTVAFLIKRTGRYRPFVTIGCGIYLLGLLLMLRYRQEGSTIFEILGTQMIIGIGGGFLNVPAQLGVQASSSHQEVAAATAMFLTALEMGGAIGAAISGAIWGTIPKKLEMYLPPESQGDAAEIFGKLTKALEYPMGSPTRIAINRAYQETMDKLLIMAILVSLPLIPLSLAMRNYQLDKVRYYPLFCCYVRGDADQRQMNQGVKGTVIGHSGSRGGEYDNDRSRPASK